MSSNTSSGDTPDRDPSVSGLDPAVPTPDLSSDPASRPTDVPADPADAAPTDSNAAPDGAIVSPTAHAEREGEPAPQPATSAEARPADATSSEPAAPSSDAAPSTEAAPSSGETSSEATGEAARFGEAPIDEAKLVLPQSFDELELPDALRRAIARLGWTKPSPVQALSFGPLIAGRDVLVQSHTGSGKTGAFCMPWLASRFDPRPAAQTGVQLLVLLPTRELAKQVCDELNRLALETPVEALPVYGGTPMNPQLAALRAGVHAVVGTPGRILDHIRRRSLDLSKVTTVVLDECDEMLSMGFLEDIRAILDQVTGKHQTALFSATIPSDVDRIARRYMQSPQSIQLSGDMVAAAEIDHAYYLVNSAIKTRDLLDLVMVEDPARAIIFCNTREETKLVASVLRREGFHAEELSSDLNQTQRERVMKAMREHKIRFLVATDVAARGIDISHVTHVINYSFPESAEVYVHRTGRTGRAGRTGTALSLISPREIGNFYYLKLQYGTIVFTERQLPPAEQLATERMEFKLDGISKRFPELVSPEWVLLARSLMADPRGERVIALLLERAMRAAPRPEPIVDVDAEAAAAATTGDTTTPTESTPEVRPTGPGEVIERESRDLREGREPRDRGSDRGEFRSDRGPRRDRGERDRGPRREFRDRPRDGEFRSDRPRDEFRGDRPRDNDRPRDESRSDRLRDNDRPRDESRSDRPRDEFRGDRPRDNDRPRDESRSDRPRDEFRGDRPRDNDRPRDGAAPVEGSREFGEGREEGRRRRDRRDRRRDRDDRGPRPDRPRLEGRPGDAPSARPDQAITSTTEVTPAGLILATPDVAQPVVAEPSATAAPTTPPAPGQLPLSRRGKRGDQGKFILLLAAPATTAPVPEAIADAGESHPAGDDNTNEGRRRRRRKRRRGRRDDLDTVTTPPTDGASPVAGAAPIPADAESDDDDDDDATDEAAQTGDPSDANGEGRRRRRRRRRGRDGASAEVRPAPVPTPPPPPAIVPVPPPRRLSQDEIVIDIDENELAVVNDEFGEIEDEFDEFALMDRRQAVIETLQEEVELEDVSGRDALAGEAIADEADDAEEDDADDEVEEAATPAGATPEAQATGDAESGDARNKKKRRRRRKKAAPLVTPELTAPPHKDFWEVWAGKYTFHDFEDDKFVSPNPVPDEPEEPPVPADRPASTSRPSRPDHVRSERPREPREARPDRPRRPEPPPRASAPRPAVDVEEGEFVKVSLNLGRTHGHKAATIRGLLRDHLGLEGRAVRDLTVRDADTLLRIPAGELPRVQTDLQNGIREGDVALAIAPAEDEADLRAPQPEDHGAIAVAMTEVVALTGEATADVTPEPAPEAAPVADDAGTT